MFAPPQQLASTATSTGTNTSPEKSFPPAAASSSVHAQPSNSSQLSHHQQQPHSPPLQHQHQRPPQPSLHPPPPPPPFLPGGFMIPTMIPVPFATPHHGPVPYINAHHPHHHPHHHHAYPPPNQFMIPAPTAGPPHPPHMPIMPAPLGNNISSSSSGMGFKFTLPEIFPFSIDFGMMTRKELDDMMRATYPKNPYVSWYTAWNELRKGKRENLLTIGQSPNSPNFKYQTSNDDGSGRRRRLFVVPKPVTFIHQKSPIRSSETSSSKTSASQPVSKQSTSSSANGSSSWASLFRLQDRIEDLHIVDGSSLSPAKKSLSSQSPNDSAFATAYPSPISKTNGIPAKNSLKNFIKSYQVQNESVLLTPRGLVNRGNMCFMNAILQPLLHCGPFYHFLHNLSISVPHDFQNSRPLIDALIMFVKEFVHDDGLSDEERRGMPFTEAFTPEYVYDALNADARFKSSKGKQQDAEEFLGFLLDGLHEELIKECNAEEMTKEEEDQWIEVGAKSRPAVTRNIEIKESPITRLFGGSMRSTLKRHGQKDSVNIEPFHSLQLDISHDDVNSVQDALIHMIQPEIIEGYGQHHQQATKQIHVEKLPPVLVLHVKRFIFTDGKTEKLQKHLDYSLDLEIPNETLAPFKRSSDSVIYKLFGVVYHHGKSATDGHYTCDCRRSNGEWLRIDDILISKITPQQVLETANDRTAYLLFYIRDFSSSQPSNR